MAFPLVEEIRLDAAELQTVRAIHQFTPNHLLVLDSRQALLAIYDQNGSRSQSTPGKGQGPGEMLAPTDMALAGDHIFVSDVQSQQVHVFDRQTLQYVDRFRTLDGWEILVKDDQIFLAAPHLETDSSIHVFDRSGNLQRQFLPIPDITKNHRLISSGISMDMDARGRLYVIHEMDYRIHRFDNQLKPMDVIQGNHRIYQPPPDKVFDKFYSRPKTEAWLFSWTHLQRVVCLDEPELVLVSMSHFDEEMEAVDVYDMAGKHIGGWQTGRLQLITTTADNHVIFLDVDSGDKAFRLERRRVATSL